MAEGHGIRYQLPSIPTTATRTDPSYTAPAQAPLAGIILCCSGLPTEERDRIHKVSREMGASCTFDLTIENTHLVIGQLNTPKYRYVAKERPDIKVVLPSFIDEIRKVWIAGGNIIVQDVEESERAPALHGLSICLTGFTNGTGPIRKLFLQTS